MQKFNLARRLFDMEEPSSNSSADSVIFESSSSNEGQSDEWDSDRSTDTDNMIRKITPSPVLIAGRNMTIGNPEEEMTAGPSTALSSSSIIPKFDRRYFDEMLCYAPRRGAMMTKIELCKNLLLIIDSPVSPPAQERGLPKKLPWYSR